MIYRNVKSGVEINISSKLVSPGWMEVSNGNEAPPKEVKKNGRGKKLRKPE